MTEVKTPHPAAQYFCSMTDWRFDVLEIEGGWGLTDSHGPLRLFVSAQAALDWAKIMAAAKSGSKDRVEIYTWSNGREQKVFDNRPIG